MPRYINSLLAIILLASPTFSEERVDLVKPASANGVVEVVNTAGSVTVIGWTREEVQVQGVLGQGSERLDFDAGPRRTVVRVVWPHNCRACEGSKLTIKVPLASDLSVEVVSADIAVQDTTGPCTLKSVSGGVRVSGSASQVVARSVSGGVRVEGARGPVRAKSVSGDVLIDGVEGSLEGSTVSGDIKVGGSTISRADLAAVSGSIRWEGTLAPAACLEAKTVSGDITLVLPAETAANFQAMTFSGSIRNDFGPEAKRVSQYTPERELSFATGSGGARIVLKSQSGSISLRQR